LRPLGLEAALTGIRPFESLRAALSNVEGRDSGLGIWALNCLAERTQVSSWDVPN